MEEEHDYDDDVIQEGEFPIAHQVRGDPHYGSEHYAHDHPRKVGSEVDIHRSGPRSRLTVSVRVCGCVCAGVCVCVCSCVFVCVCMNINVYKDIIELRTSLQTGHLFPPQVPLLLNL